MTNKEKFDIKTMRYFTHPRKYHTRITKQDEQAMVNLSSRGIKPQRMTKGLNCLIWGKTYRDEQITAYKRDIALGYFTKWEIISSYPKDMRDWIKSKIASTPYDVNNDTSQMLVKMYQNGVR